MIAFVVSDVGEWTAYFDTLIQLHKQRVDSPFWRSTVHWPIRLVNTATTQLKNGQMFPYYQVVDQGRGAIGGGSLGESHGIGNTASTTNKGGAGARKGFIVFASREGAESGSPVTFSKRVRGTTGHQITAKSELQTAATFTIEVSRVFNKWLNTKNEEAWAGEGRPPHKGFKTTVRRASRRVGVSGEGTIRTSGPKKAKASAPGDLNRRPGESDDDFSTRLEKAADALLAALDTSDEPEPDIETPLELEEALEIVSTPARATLVNRAGNKDKAYNAFVKKAKDKSISEFDQAEFLRKAEAAKLRARAVEQARIDTYVSKLQSDRALSNIGLTEAAYKRDLAREVARAHIIANAQAGRFTSRTVRARGFSSDSTADTSGGMSGFNPGRLERVQVDPPKGDQRGTSRFMMLHQGKGGVQNEAIKAFIKLPNWVALAGIFVKVTGDQIEKIWKPNTPVRGDYKLSYFQGGKKVIMGRSSGGNLRNGYHLVTTKELMGHLNTANFIRGKV